MLRAVEVERPQAGDRRLGVADVDGELLLAPRLLVLVDRVRRHEVDAPAVGRPLPRADAGRVLGDLLRGRGVDAGRPAADTAVPRRSCRCGYASQRPSSAEREIRHALLRIGDPARLAAVGTHHVELIARRGALRRFAVRQEDEEAAVARPARRRLVLLLRERHLPGRRHALLQSTPGRCRSAASPPSSPAWTACRAATCRPGSASGEPTCRICCMSRKVIGREPGVCARAAGTAISVEAHEEQRQYRDEVAQGHPRSLRP